MVGAAVPAGRSFQISNFKSLIFYNDNNPEACAWLRELIRAGELPDGIVDQRSISDIKPDELRHFTQCHFFAGIGGWPLALKLAGWPYDRPVWTGSCPCQPFSQAGKKKGTRDKRHLWPVFKTLIAQMAYAVGAADLCAAGVSAPHIRQRLFWVAHHARERSVSRGMADTASPELRGQSSTGHESRHGQDNRCHSCGLEHTHGSGCGELRGPESMESQLLAAQCAGGGHPWSDFVLIPCRDGKARRIKSGLQPLAHGISGRVGLLRGYGNAIIPLLAAEFIQAFLETEFLIPNS